MCLNLLYPSVKTLLNEPSIGAAFCWWWVPNSGGSRGKHTPPPPLIFRPNFISGSGLPSPPPSPPLSVESLHLPPPNMNIYPVVLPDRTVVHNNCWSEWASRIYSTSSKTNLKRAKKITIRLEFKVLTLGWTTSLPPFNDSIAPCKGIRNLGNFCLWNPE